MATKSADCLLPGIHQNPSISNNDFQYNNLNLNQNQNFKIDFVGSKIKSSQNTKVQNKCKNKRLPSLSWKNKSITVICSDLSDLNNFGQQSKKISPYSFDNNRSQSVTSEYLNGFQNEEKNWKKGSGSNDTSSDTLSLYISAFGNDETNNTNDQSLTYQNHNSGKTLKDLKHEFHNVGLINGMFEIPRQQKDETKEPEIMQFKSSQKLINPNQTKFDQLKEKANKLFQEEKYNEAIKAYTEILTLSNLSVENQATIYSNRSASYLLVGNSLKSAKIDAEKAIKLWPSWWKGYYRLARVYVVQENWNEAETNLQKAMALNSESKEIRDEISFVRSQIGETLRGEKNNPAFAPLTPEEDAKKVCNQLGISEKQFYDLQKNAKNFPKFDFVLKGHQYRDGFVVPQNFKKAAEFYEKAANLGNPEGMFNLGLLYKEGKGVKRDYGESMKWFFKAANSKTLIMRGSGIAEAQHSIGLYYVEGVGVEQDYRKAAKWYEKAVANNFGPSANNLGMLYLNGLGVEKSAVKAFNYFKFSAESGDTTAMINLADCYFDAVGTVLNIPTQEYINEGKKWLRRAVEKGDVRAVAELRKRENMNSSLHNVLSYPSCSPLERIKADLKRKLFLIQQRELFIKFAQTYGLPTFVEAILQPPCTPNPPNWNSSPKEITLKDMDPTKDKVYNGCFIKVRIIDWPLIADSIQTKIEDLNGDVNRLAIYKWPETDIQKYNVPEAMKIFRPNIIVSIINPYHRISMDGQSTIRVEGPEFVKLNTSMINKLCHVCGKEAKSLPSCSNCKMALYCSKECQKHDWTEFNHKGICKHLKMFSSLM